MNARANAQRMNVQMNERTKEQTYEKLLSAHVWQLHHKAYPALVVTGRCERCSVFQQGTLCVFSVQTAHLDVAYMHSAGCSHA